MDNYEQLAATYPRKHPELPETYKKIYNKHYSENRGGKTKASSLSSKMEQWLHKKVAKTANNYKSTLEIGAGTLNQLDYENSTIYDIIEPFELLFNSSQNLKKINEIYKDIADIPISNKYDRITAIACFEHICNLPDVVRKSGKLLSKNGVLCISIPNEGRFLWKFAYTMTTGIEFKKRFGLDYEIMMTHEHINTADDIEVILKHFFKNVKMSTLGIGKTFSFYRYYECSSPTNLN